MKTVLLGFAAVLVITTCLTGQARASACYPEIVDPSNPFGSIIEAYGARRARAAIIVDWGSCTISDNDFR